MMPPGPAPVIITQASTALGFDDGRGRGGCSGQLTLADGIWVHPPSTPAGLLTGFASSATGRKASAMPIDPAMLAKSIGTLSDLHPDQDLPAALQQAVLAAKSLFDADAAGIMLTDADGQLRWASASDQRAQTLEDNQEVFAAGPCAEAFASGRR
jgi:hypothetical protein